MIIYTQKSSTVNVTRNAGFSLFELLVALLVLAIGLMGFATLQSQGINRNTSSTFRSEATFLAMDLSERMRANMSNGLTQAANVAALGATTAYGIDSTGGGACGGNPDACAWLGRVQAQLPSGQAQVTTIAAGGPFLITLMWDDARQGATGTGCTGATTDMLCFQTLFMP